jgi:hypothetical protein
MLNRSGKRKRLKWPERRTILWWRRIYMMDLGIHNHP